MDAIVFCRQWRPYPGHAVRTGQSRDGRASAGGLRFDAPERPGESVVARDATFERHETSWNYLLPTPEKHQASAGPATVDRSGKPEHRRFMETVALCVAVAVASTPSWEPENSRVFHPSDPLGMLHPRHRGNATALPPRTLRLNSVRDIFTVNPKHRFKESEYDCFRQCA